MVIEHQYRLFSDNGPIPQHTPSILSKKEWGTFKDSLRAPIHRWFTYPAGFSYKAVEYSLKTNSISRGHTVYDPFMGSGTTNVVAKKLGVNSYGVEAHPFVFTIAQSKLEWDINSEEIITALHNIEKDTLLRKKEEDPNDFQKVAKEKLPDLVTKCYEANTLLELLYIRDSLETQNISYKSYRFLLTGLTCLLRQVSTAATGWPYIAPKKKKVSSNGKIPIVEFKKIISGMLDDIRVTVFEADSEHKNSKQIITNGDSRNTASFIEDSSIDHIFTSPPYLNNFDYADRTRLELYFFGKAKTWGDITETVRSKLITSATTQISRNDPRYTLSQDLKLCCPEVYFSLESAIKELSRIRLLKGGKKSYDLLVSGYFNDMYLQLKDTFRVLKNGRKAIYVLGDSAPYGVHIPTDEFIGKIGVSLGFSTYDITELRLRGGKWGANPQRHKVQLKESVVILTKD